MEISEYNASVTKWFLEAKAKTDLTIAHQQEKIKNLEEAPEDVDDDESQGVEEYHDVDGLQQPNPFKVNQMWSCHEMWHDMEGGADGGQKPNELQVAFKKGLFNPYLPEMEVLIHQHMEDQDRKAKKNKTNTRKGKAKGDVKEGAVWRGCSYNYLHFHLVQVEGEEVQENIVNIEDNGAQDMEPFCLKTAKLPHQVLRPMKTATKKGIDQEAAEAQWDFMKTWTKEFKVSALAAQKIDSNATCKYAKPTSNDMSCYEMPDVIRKLRSLSLHFRQFIHKQAKAKNRFRGLPWKNTGNNNAYRFGMTTLHLHWSGEGDYLLPHVDVKQKDTVLTVSVLFGATLFMYV